MTHPAAWNGIILMRHIYDVSTNTFKRKNFPFHTFHTFSYLALKIRDLEMNQNGMQGAAGVPQQIGQQVQQQPKMPGDQPENPQIMKFLNEVNENNWKEESYRNLVGYFNRRGALKHLYVGETSN